MTNEELGKAIKDTNEMLAHITPQDARFIPWMEHLKALLHEQKERSQRVDQ